MFKCKVLPGLMKQKKEKNNNIVCNLMKYAASVDYKKG